MARASAKRVARKLLSLSKGMPAGANAQARAAARRILEGSERAGDEDLVFRTLGYGASGRAAIKQIRRYADPLRNIGMAAVLAAQESKDEDVGFGVAGAILVNTATREFERILNTKYVKKTAEEVGRRFGNTRIGQALGINQVSTVAGINRLVRFARIGGVALTAATLGQEVVLGMARHFERQAKALDKRRQIIEQAFMQYNIAPERLISLERLVDQEATQLNTNWGTAVNLLTERMGIGKTDAQIKLEAQLMAQYIDRIKQVRQEPGVFGVNEQRVLTAEAARQQKQVYQLTPRERDRAIDEAIRKENEVESLKRKREIQARVESRFNQEFRRRYESIPDMFGEYAQRAARDYVAQLTFHLVENTARLEARRKKEIELEEEQKYIDKRLETGREARQRAVEEHERLNVTPAMRMRRHELELVASASFQGRRSRHRARNDD